MKETRKLFILNGASELVSKALNEITFKGLCCFDRKISSKEATEVFKKNKSIVCCGVTNSILSSKAINIAIVENNYILVPETNAINVNGNIAEQFMAIANYHHCDIGDHKSNTSASKEAPKRSDCPYCSYVDDGHCDIDLDLHRTLYRSENFFVMPTIGEFVEGYLLIIPFDHVMSNGELSIEKRHEFLEVLDDVFYMLKLTYASRNFLVWENGSGNGGSTKAKTSIVHSHTHVVACNLDVNQISKISQFPFKELSYDDLHLHQENSYLLIRGNYVGSWFINDDPSLYIPRQYIRQLILEKDYSHIPSYYWDWRAYPFIDKIEQTCKDIKSALLNNWVTVPHRIKKNTKYYL